MGGPGFCGGKRWAPHRQDLRALVDTFKPFFGFRYSFNRGNPKLFCAWSVERDANTLPAVFDSECGARNAAAKAEVLRPRRSLKKAIGLGRRQEIQHRFDANSEAALEYGRNGDFHLKRDFATP